MKPHIARFNIHTYTSYASKPDTNCHRVIYRKWFMFRGTGLSRVQVNAFTYWVNKLSWDISRS